MHAVFNLKPADRPKVDEVLKDDLVSRQSITVREASALGLSGLGTLVFVEGEERAVARAAEVLGGESRLEGKQLEDAYRAFKTQDEDVASGVGLIFGA